jgi:hypothetical protein
VSGKSDRKQKESLVLLFISTHATLAAEETILDSGFWCDMVPRPPGTSDDLCGLAIEVRSGDEAGITKLLENAAIAFTTYKREGQNES